MKTINSLRSKLLALTLALMASVSTFAKDGYPDFQVDELYYNFLEGDSVQVTFLMPPTIPTEVAADTSNKKNVSGAGYVHLTEIVIPSTVIYEDKTYHVTRIGHGAFMYCPNLMHIDLPTSIKSIGEAAFHNCRYLSSITLNEGLESIEQQAFWNCSTLKEVSLPSTLKSLGQKVFGESTSLSKVICKALVPPSVEKDLLTGTDNYNASIIPNATLYVPASSLTTYQNTYPWNTFGQILSIEDSLQNIFPTLAGLQRTHTIEMYDHVPNDGKHTGGYPLPFASVKDTVINGKTYLQFGDYVNGSNYSLFFLREENNKVLIYSSILQNDLVLYDYTLELGDSLPAITSDHDYFSDDHFTKLDKAEDIFTYVVTDVSTVTLLDGIERKKWILKNKYLPIIEYVEGIGCYGENTSHSGDFFRLIHDHPYRTEYVGDHLVCVSKNGQLLYSMTQEEMNSFTLTCECLSQSSYKSQWCDTWNVMWFDGMRFDETASTSQYRLGKDTIIGDYTYSKFTSRTSVRFTDDRKVYVYYEGFDDNDPYTEDLPTGEYLAYDFSAQVGDTLEVFSGVHSYSKYKCLVHEVQTDPETKLRTITLFQLLLEDTDGDGVEEEYGLGEMTWIEGVGSPNGFLINTTLPGGGLFTLLCAYKDDELKYTGSFYERFGCDYNAGVISDDLFPTLSGLQRTICREYCEQADNKTRIEQFTNLTTRTETGAPYIYYSPFLLREKDNKILIYSRSLNKDLVLYDFNLQVGDSLPMLYIDFFAEDDWIADRDMEIWCVVDYHKDLEGNILPADTLIVTDVSAITLLDGKEYKKWTFNNGMEYVEGIGSFGNGQWSGDFFQLIANRGVPTSLHGEYLVCASRNNKLLYQMDDAEMERLGAECLCETTPSYKSQWCDTWNVMEHDMGMTSDTEKTWRHYLANDTIINGQTYTSVNYYWTLEESKVYKIAHVRFSEDKKVYALMDDTEYLVYDFSVQVGDTIETIVGAFSGSMLQQLLVHQIDIDGATNRKTITLYPICRIEDDEYDEDWVYLWDCCPVQWIEGVGSTDGFLMGYPPCGWVGGIGHKLLCAYKDDELQYINDLYQDDYGCEYNAVGQNPEDLFPTLWGLQRTDVELHTTGDDEAYRSVFNEYVPTLVNGKWYLYDGRNYLREENNQVLLYAPDVEIYEDIVLYDWTLEVGDTLPYHNKSVYRKSDYIVTDVSTITLLDGKEYKKWTLACGYEYIESIGAINGHGYGLFLCLPHYGHWATYIHTSLVCASRNGQLLYQMDDAEMERLGVECLCEYNSGPKKDNAKNGKIGGRPTPTQWNMLEVETKEMDGTPTILRAETFSYTLENDSIVTKGKTFYQLARQSTKDTAITKSFVGALHFGEDEDNRVYFLRDGVEYVLYDFTAEPGDTIEIFAGINNYPQETTYTHVVVDKDTTEDGACRMFLEVVFPDETTTATNAEKVWLAGLGSIDGIVHNAAKRTSDVHAAPAKSASSETQTSVMLCAWREDSCLYTTNHPEYDTFGCVYNQDPTAVEDVETSGDKYQKIIRDGHLYILRDNKLYDVLGTPMN